MASKLSTKPSLRKFLARFGGTVETSKAISAAKNQPTPLGINRFILLTIYVFYTFLTARVYFGWSHFSSILFKFEIYGWRCSGGEDLRNQDKRYICTEQDQMIQTLFIICLSAAFSFSMAAGTLLDIAGPKITAIIGQGLNALAWLLLAFGSETAQTFIPAFLIMGLGSDTGFLPTLPIANLFPGNEGLVVALLGGAKSASFAIPTILLEAKKGNDAITLRGLCLAYMGTGPLLCLILAVVLLPCKSFLPWNEFAVVMNEIEDTPISPPQHRFSICSLAAHTRRESMISGATVTRSRRGSAMSMTSRRSSAKFGPLEDDSPDAAHLQTLPTSHLEPPPVEKGALKGDETKDSRLPSNNTETIRKDSQEVKQDEYGITGLNDWQEPPAVVTVSFWRQFISLFNVLITVYAVIRTFMFTFYTTSMEGLIGKDASDVVGILVPFSFVPCLILGKCVDLFGIMNVLLAINSSIALAYIFSLIPGTACGIISGLWYVVYVSLYSSQLYCYVSDTFEARHFGKFVGITSLIAGLSSQLQMAYRLLVVALDYKYLYPTLIMLFLSVVAFVVLIVLYIAKRKNPHPFWPKKDDKAQVDSQDPSAKADQHA